MFKKILLTVMIGIVLISMLTSCDNTVYYWEFEQDCNAVTAIQIIDTEDGYVYDVVKELDLTLVEDLYDDINKLEMEKYGTNLDTPHGYCFLIAFENGDYDVISKTESKHFKYDQNSERMQGYNSWLRCTDTEVFDELINQYLDP